MLRALLVDVLIAAAVGGIGLVLSDGGFAWKMAAATLLGLLVADLIRRLASSRRTTGIDASGPRD